MVPLFAVQKKKKKKKKNEQKNKQTNEQTKTKNKTKPEKILSFVTDLSIPSASSKPYFILKNNQILVNTRLMIINFLLSRALRC